MKQRDMQGREMDDMAESERSKPRQGGELRIGAEHRLTSRFNNTTSLISMRPIWKEINRTEA